jgi:predicted lipoprotein with Yx(FWY)xxD motif
MKLRICTALLLGTLAMAGPALAQGAPAKEMNGILTDEAGMTLYTFDKDSGGKSACNGRCAENWPPLTASASAKPTGHYSIVTREDGTKQWAYEGKPLYRWSKDKKPGDETGNGLLNGQWHVAKAE